MVTSSSLPSSCDSTALIASIACTRAKDARAQEGLSTLLEAGNDSAQRLRSSLPTASDQLPLSPVLEAGERTERHSRGLRSPLRWTQRPASPSLLQCRASEPLSKVAAGTLAFCVVPSVPTSTRGRCHHGLNMSWAQRSPSQIREERRRHLLENALAIERSNCAVSSELRARARATGHRERLPRFPNLANVVHLSAFANVLSFLPCQPHRWVRS